MLGLSGIEVSFWQQGIKVLAVLTGLVGILYLGVHLLKKFRVTRLGEQSCIRVLETHYLTPKATLHLVAVGPARFLVGNAGERLTLLTALPLRDEEGEGAQRPLSHSPCLTKCHEEDYHPDRSWTADS